MTKYGTGKIMPEDQESENKFCCIHKNLVPLEIGLHLRLIPMDIRLSQIIILQQILLARILGHGVICVLLIVNKRSKLLPSRNWILKRIRGYDYSVKENIFYA